MLTDLEKDAIRHHYQTLAGALPGFKPRAAQRQMIAAIAKTLSQSLDGCGEVLLVGTRILEDSGSGRVAFEDSEEDRLHAYEFIRASRLPAR